MTWHDILMDAYYSAREAWLDAAEAASSGYATEWAEFAAANPRPTLKQFLLDQKGMRRNVG